MALTVRRWLFLAGIGALALAVAYLPPQPSPETPSRTLNRPERQRLERLNDAYVETQDLLNNVRFRDSLRRVLTTKRDTGGIEVAFRIALPEESYALVRAAAQRLWSQLNPQPGARTIVILGVGRRWQGTYLLPAMLDGRTCAASIELDWVVQWLRHRSTQERGTNLEPWLRDAIAPCLYYAVFGSPGQAVAAWLTGRAFVPAYTADWSAPAAVLGLDEPSRLEYTYFNSSFDALACTTGRTARCSPALLDRPEFVGRSGMAGMVRRYYLRRDLPAETYYLANLVHEMGRERFGAFWRSDKTVPEAFASAFGQPMDRWTATWARNAVPDLTPFGPAPRPVAVFFGVALAALAIAAAAAGVVRRQVG